MTGELDIPFQGIVEQSLAGMYVIQDEIFLYVNATFAGMLGYTPEEMTGMHLRDAVVPELQEQAIANYHLRVSGQIPSIRYLTSARHKLGHTVHLEVHGSSLLYRGRQAVVGVGINITEQVSQQAELRQSRERLRELAAYINTVREEQRSRIARELHDVVGGLLTSMKLDIQRIVRRTEDREIGEITAGLLALVQESIDTVRSISEDLRPGLLDHLGLQAALSSALREFSQRSEIACELVETEPVPPLSQARATAIYRICQEALTNIARHARATRVCIRLGGEDGALRVEIEDNGCGLPSLTPLGKSIGLLSMQERAREIGGELSTRVVSQGGTCLVLRLPAEEYSD